MSDSVDDRIVAMKFDNKQFEPGVKQTEASLKKLNEALAFKDGTKGLDKVSASAGKFNMGNMKASVEGVSKGFVALSTIAVTALATITAKAVTAGLGLVKSLTIQPILDGYREYETQLGSIQTILANTKASGATLGDVNKTLAELNRYSDKTIYNFGEMAKNIGTFTAAGVDLKTSAAAIKGIANLAALSGSNSQQASTAMYQLSQAIASGKVGLQDWNSVVNAGMGGTVFKRALAENAVAMGALEKSAVKLVGPMKNVTVNGLSFRDSMAAKPGEVSWLSSDVLTQTLKQFTGDLTDAELAAEGFNKAQIKAIQAQAKTAQEAATKVKTASQLFDTLKESVGSGWSRTFQTIFGNFTEARELFTGANNVLGGIIQSSANARNKILSDWKKMGGRTILIQAISDAFNTLMKVVGAVKRAFAQVFPPATGKTLLNLTKGFQNLVDRMTPGIDTLIYISRIFKGLFSILDIGWQIVKGVFSVIGDLLGVVGEGSDGFLAFAARIGDALYNFDQFLKKGQFIEKFFDGLGAVLKVPLKILGAVAQLIGGLFAGFASGAADAATSTIGRFGDRIDSIVGLGQKLASFGKVIGKVFSGIVSFLQPALDAIGDAFGNLGDALAESIQSGDFSGVFDALNTVLLGGIALVIRNFFKNGGKLGLDLDVGGGLFGSIKETFGELTGTMQAMQTNIKADTLMKIAIAIGILTASVVALSLIDSAALTKALTAMAVGFGQLLGAMAILTQISGTAGFVKVPFIAASLSLLAIAILLLTASVAALSRLSWEELAKGLTGVAVLMGVLAAATHAMNNAGMIRAGAGMILVAVAIKILASAVADFAQLSWKDMVKGLIGVGAALTVIAIAMSLMPANMALTGAGLVLVGAGLKIVASALGDFGSMDWKVIGKGLVAMAAALLVIAGAMAIMPPSMILQAAGLLVLGVALQSIGKALASMGGMSWKEIGKGLVTMAAALVVLAAGLYLMTGAIGGAAALIIAAGALAIIAPVLKTLGSMSWEAIVKGLVALAGAFTVIGLAGLILTPLIPSLIGLGLAMTLIGAGMALAGAGALAFSVAFTALAVAGAAGVEVLGSAIETISKMLPQIATAIAESIGSFAVGIIMQIPKIVKAIEALLMALLGVLEKVIPKAGKVIWVLIQTILDILVKGIPAIARAGIAILIGLLTAIRNNIYRVVAVVVGIITEFLRALGDQLPKIADAGAKLIIKLVNGISDAIDNNSEEMGRAGGHLATAIVEGMINGLKGAVDEVVSAAKDLAKAALDGAKDFLHIKSPSKRFMEIGMYSARGMAIGIQQNSKLASDAAAEMGAETLDVVKLSMKRVAEEAAMGIDLTPVIRPVVDLSELTRASARIHAAMPNMEVRAASAEQFVEARRLAAMGDRSGLDRGDFDTDTQTLVAPSITQNFNTPKTPSPTEIYRNTKNALSLAKEALKPG